MNYSANPFVEQLRHIMPTALTGSVVRTLGTTVAVAGFPAPVGALVEICRQAGDVLPAEVIGFRDEMTLVYPLGEILGVQRGNLVRLVKSTRYIRVGKNLLGRVVDASGNCIDGKPQPILPYHAEINREPPLAVSRPRITTPLTTGIRAIDAFLTCGKGQRIGVFSGSGVGKSVALGMIARYTTADINVIGLIGERGREVNEFIQRDLGPEGLARSVIVVATSDQPALVRVRAAQTATAIAEFFRDNGASGEPTDPSANEQSDLPDSKSCDVLLMMDSLTRFAMAQREIGLAAGEPPTTRGFTPSVFAMLPKLVERAGMNERGSITGIYTVLVEGDDQNEPVADAVRGLLDGHTWLSRKLASAGHYPAIDLLESISRVMPDIVSEEIQNASLLLRRLLAAYREHEDLITIGAYRTGSNREVDLAIEMRDPINALLRQRVNEVSSMQQSQEALLKLAAAALTRLRAGEADPIPRNQQSQTPHASESATASTNSA